MADLQLMVAYRLTMEASHRDAVLAYLTVAPVAGYDEQGLVHELDRAVSYWAQMWRWWAGVGSTQMTVAEAVAGARAWLADRLDELNAFTARLEQRTEEMNR